MVGVDGSDVDPALFNDRKRRTGRRLAAPNDQVGDESDLSSYESDEGSGSDVYYDEMIGACLARARHRAGPVDIGVFKQDFSFLVGDEELACAVLEALRAQGAELPGEYCTYWGDMVKGRQDQLGG